MSHAIQPPDILPTVLSRVQELGQTPLARRLAEIRIGPASLWDALRYDVADAVYDDTYRDLARPRELPPPSSAPARRAFGRAGDAIVRNLWQGQVGEELLVGLLSARLGLLGDLLEAGVSRVVGRTTRRHDGHRAHVLVAGSMYRAAVAALGPVLHTLARDHGLGHLVVAHDDVLVRHGRAFHRLGLRWRHAATFSHRAHRQAASEVVRRTRMALAESGAPEGLRLPEAVSRRSLSERHVRRLVVNFLAAQDAMHACDPSVVVIPDERQPLARLVGLEARRRGLPVVSAPLARDQVYRKAPLWDSLVSTRILVFSPLAARFLGRAGAPPHVFECVAGVPLEPQRLGDQAPGPSGLRDSLGPARARIVLFASQGQPMSSVLLPMLAARTAALPDVALVIRPHPNEWRPLVKLMNRGVHVSTALTARQALRAADVLVTHSSFMAVEAALVDRPVMLVSPEPVPSLLPLITEGLARWVCTSADLQRGLQDLLENGDGALRAAQARFRKEQAGLPGLERATDVIADLARHPS